MTPDDHDDDDRQPGPGDADNPTRDARGRWPGTGLFKTQLNSSRS